MKRSRLVREGKVRKDRMVKVSNGKGMTSKEFIEFLENPRNRAFGDMRVMDMTEDDFKRIAMGSKTVSDFVRKLKEDGHSEFSVGWGARILVSANVKMRQMAEFLQMLQGGIDDSEQEKINATMKETGSSNLRYIG